MRILIALFVFGNRSRIVRPCNPTSANRTALRRSTCMVLGYCAANVGFLRISSGGWSGVLAQPFSGQTAAARAHWRESLPVIFGPARGSVLYWATHSARLI